jgi:hypothetical protein
MSLLSLLDPRLWGAFLLAIAISGGAGYFKGSHDATHRAGLEQAAAIAASNVEARKMEQLRQRGVDEAARAAATRANDDRARIARADNAVDGMRDALDAAERAIAGSGDAAAKTAAALRADLGSCVAEYRSLGKDAAGFASDSLMYQQAWPR